MIEKYFVTHTCKNCCYEGIGEQKDGIEYEELNHQDVADLLNSQEKRILELEKENQRLKNINDSLRRVNEKLMTWVDDY